MIQPDKSNIRDGGLRKNNISWWEWDGRTVDPHSVIAYVQDEMEWLKSRTDRQFCIVRSTGGFRIRQGLRHEVLIKNPGQCQPCRCVSGLAASVCVHTYVTYSASPSACRTQKSLSDPLNLELQVVVCRRELNLGPLKEQQALSAAKASLEPLIFCDKDFH